MVYNDTVFIYTGHDEDGATWYVMNEWRAYSSVDMVNWTDRGAPLSYKTFSWALEGTAWAAQCIERNGKFYWYVTVTPKGLGAASIGVAVSDSPTGPFIDPIGKPLVAAHWGDIDPTVFIDDDGQAYLYWGNPNLWYVKLNEDMISYEGDVIQVPLTKEGFGERFNDPDRSTLYEEGPWFYKRNGLYYLLWAGGPLPEHIGYSTSSSPIGPWEYRGVIMPAQGGSFTNHPGVVDFKGKSYFVYHSGALPGGGGFTRSVCVDEFEYNPDGTFPTLNMKDGIVNGTGNLNPYTRTEFETIAWGNGIETEENSTVGVYVTDIDNGDYIKVRAVDFGTVGAGTFTASVASAVAGGNIELRLDALNGTVIGTLPISFTGGWDKWQTKTTSVSGATGIHDLYLIFKGAGTDKLFNADYWKFEEKTAAHNLVALNATIDKYKIDVRTGANTANLNVLAVYADGTNETITAQAAVTSQPGGIVTIADGVVTGVGYGAVNIQVSYGGKTDLCPLIVKDLVAEQTAKTLTVEPSEISLIVGTSAAYTATVEYMDGHTSDVTKTASYHSSRPTIAEVSAGTIQAKALGETNVNLGFQGGQGDEVTAQIRVKVYSEESYQLYKTLESAKKNYLSFAIGAASLKTEMDNAESLLNRQDATSTEIKNQTDVLLSAITAYFQAQMLSESDVSTFIQNGTFSGGDKSGWQVQPGAVNEGVGEFFSTPFDMKQTLSGLDNGYYLTFVQGFYRDGGNDAGEKYQNGTEELDAFLFANTDSVALSSLYSYRRNNWGLNGYANGMGEANAAFSENINNYANYLITNITDGMLTLGLRKTTPSVWGDWCCFDNFRLFKIPTSGNAIQTPKADAINPDTRIYNLLGRVVGKADDVFKLESGIYITEHKKIIICK
jgi:hypothetical protein